MCANDQELFSLLRFDTNVTFFLPKSRAIQSKVSAAAAPCGNVAVHHSCHAVDMATHNGVHARDRPGSHAADMQLA